MEALRKLRAEHSITQQKLANDIGVSRSTIAMWETGGSEPDNSSLNRLSDYFNVSIDYLLDNNSHSERKGVLIPVLGRVQAGLPIETVEEIIDYEEITPELASRGEYFALKVKGQSMEPKFSDGDVVIVRKQPDVDSGDIAIVLVNGHEATIKKIKKQVDGVSLIPSNPAFDIMFFSNKEIIELPVTIIGKVVELRAKF